jgi:spore maturation protein CgeB
MDRPRRIQIKDELGKFKSLAFGPGTFERFDSGRSALFLGLGPEPREATRVAGEKTEVFYLEAPAFKEQMPGSWREAIPEDWRELPSKELTPALIRSSEIFLYRQAPRLFPSFYGPLLARCRLALLRSEAKPEATVLLPGDENDLLLPELGRAFTALGPNIQPLDASASGTDILKVLQGGRPGLFFSVNFKGLDPWGENFHLLREAGVAVAVWCVDNPFHLISKLRAPFWKRTPLFVTDARFIPLLEKHGASFVYHLPLATDPVVFAGTEPEPGLSGRIAFAGRSEFPDKAGFFAGQEIPEELLAEARDMLGRGKRPDYAYWLERLELESLWPGTGSRRAGLAAEECARMQRAMALSEAAKLPLTVFGDENWQGLVPEIHDLRPPVDYYTALPGIYAGASLTLNVTSLLLPAGLTQRHFDVWAAGGVLVTDATPGLSIFPGELTREITFERPMELPDLARRLLDDERLKRDLRSAWHDLIISEHTFDHRAQRVLDLMQPGKKD